MIEMLVNMKYHLVTIMALFITLAIGILIGSTIIGNDSISKQQQRLISDLKSDFKILRKENHQFETQINKLEKQLAANLKYRKKVLSVLFKDRLKGEKLLVINGDNIEKEMLTKVINYLELSQPQVINLLKESNLKAKEYTKIIILGQVNKEARQKYFNSDIEVIQLSKTELSSFSKTIEKLLKLISQTSFNSDDERS